MRQRYSNERGLILPRILVPKLDRDAKFLAIFTAN
jgi:hypothetical protein